LIDSAGSGRLTAAGPDACLGSTDQATASVDAAPAAFMFAAAASRSKRHAAAASTEIKTFCEKRITRGALPLLASW